MSGMKKKILILAMMSTVLLSGCAGALKDGAEALESGDYETAAASFQKAVSEKGDREDMAAAYKGLGMADYELGSYADALEAFESAVDNGAEQTAELYNLMGVSAMQTGDYEKGLEYIQAGLALTDAASSDGESTDSGLIQEMEYNEIVCMERQADWESAKEKIAAYIEKYPDDETAQKEAEFLETR